MPTSFTLTKDLLVTTAECQDHVGMYIRYEEIAIVTSISPEKVE